MLPWRNSSSIDLEAANYFELDLNQLHALSPKSHNRDRSHRRIRLKEKTSLTTHKPFKIETQMQDQKPPDNSNQKLSTKHVSNRRVRDQATNEEASREDRKGRQNEMDRTSLSVEVNQCQSPSTSTCSLPSISSSPSLSPSLVCPHLSLDDILSRGYDDGKNQSAHTIGLCEKCLVYPPPDIHSPLSPAFRPSISRQAKEVTQSCSSKTTQLMRSDKLDNKMALRRGYSDQHMAARKTSRIQKLPQDDSLDYYLEPIDLKRLQMSPTIRHSVEYIRNNVTEAGRVIKIYKNGRPFDKPLRICIMRGEFANLNHLLDHINSRQLIQSGARYLFHLDGQLVYSENELKHDSCYIVSGTRNFDYKVNSVLKEQQQKTKQVKLDGKQESQMFAVEPRTDKHNTSYFLTSQHHHSSDSLNREQKVSAKSQDISPQTNTSKAETNSVRVSIKVVPPALRPTSQDRSSLVTIKKNISQLEPTAKMRVSQTKRLPANEAVVRKAAKSTFRSGHRGSTGPPRVQKVHVAMSRSNENLNDGIGIVDEEQQLQPIGVVRAKSELSALPNEPKRKKNVTFVDTGRGSSPAINLEPPENTDSTVEPTDVVNRDNITSTKELETSEIGIQVSDSIEGYLIDLPIELPADKLTGKRGPIRTTNRQTNNKLQQSGRKRKQGKIITITERQLSFDEMGKLKDLDAGDHHNESHKIQHVSITLDSIDDTETTDKEMLGEEAQTKPIEVLVPDSADDTINIGQEPEPDKLDNTDKKLQNVEDQTSSGQWQYPGDQRSGASATPTERPVSQSEANETVHARVTTPSPSLSTLGDGNSLTMSYDYYQRSDDEASAAALARLPVKHRLPVMGNLRQGLDAPAKNCTLVWINGFIINDQYPANSMAALPAPASPVQHKVDRGTSPVSGLLSPADAERYPASGQFKPSDRFHNWVCHSRRHDELVYPAGSLVILWCRWTNEQRYYSRHTSNVSAITMASLDDDLAASAQVGSGDSNQLDRSAIHLWSLSKLETLRVIDDDNFRSKYIFSLKVRNTELDGCELSICGREDNKRLWFYVLYLRMDSSKPEKSPKDQALAKQLSPKKSGQIMLKTNKPLQANQIPLLLTRLSNVRGEQPSTNAEGKSTPNPQSRKSSITNSQRADLFGNMMVSFGRRHFQVWLVDKKSQSLLPLQASNKSSYFVETIVRANCMVRMAPSEFLIGDSVGNLGLLTIQLHQSGDAKALIGSPSRLTASKYKYSIQTWPLIDSSAKGSQLKADSALASTSPITCLMRISGSLFAAADCNCAIKFWKIVRSTNKDGAGDDTKEFITENKDNTEQSEQLQIKCRQVACICLPRDLGFICSIVLSKYSRQHPNTVEFYVLSTSNAILFCTVQMQVNPVTVTDPQTSNNNKPSVGCSLSVIYEGHESPVMSLVADPLRATQKVTSPKTSGVPDDNQVGDYFTCSLDCKICKWSGKNLVWKSALPSACASLAVHPTGFVLAIGSADGTVYILDKISGLLISYFPLTPVCINCLAYSRDGTLLAAGCANGSIFILPVYERGLKYKKVSILQSPYPVVSLQFSINNKYILTSVTHGHYQELILWDLPNFRYMRNNAKMTADKIEWFDAICSGSEDVRAIWENANLDTSLNDTGSSNTAKSKYQTRRLSASNQPDQAQTKTIINLSCHRLIRDNKQRVTGGDQSAENFVIAGDSRGYLRLFRYPCPDIQQGFYEVRVGSSAISCCRFLALKDCASINDAMFVSSSLDGSICLWSLC